MSETDRPQPRDRGTAPAGVTDPLLWRLAADVVDAHQPDQTGHCDNLLCDHQEWPCDAARQARRALALSGDAPEEIADPGRDDRWESERELTALPGRRPRTAAEAA
ncbi:MULTISPECIES: hypothetical protein [unclassified Micromonospora]|uniref:hypothetical protein n=1 Tax=unclassified Micromonospora TaxID=2617518 RepID=UPI002FEFE254